jgi:hypothetical protein
VSKIVQGAKGHPLILVVGNSSGLRDPSDRLLPMTTQVVIQTDRFCWLKPLGSNQQPTSLTIQASNGLLTFGNIGVVCLESGMKIEYDCQIGTGAWNRAKIGCVVVVGSRK